MCSGKYDKKSHHVIQWIAGTVFTVANLPFWLISTESQSKKGVGKFCQLGKKNYSVFSLQNGRVSFLLNPVIQTFGLSAASLIFTSYQPNPSKWRCQNRKKWKISWKMPEYSPFFLQIFWRFLYFTFIVEIIIIIQWVGCGRWLCQHVVLQMR